MIVVRPPEREEWAEGDILSLARLQQCDVFALGDVEVTLYGDAASINPFDWKLRRGGDETLLEQVVSERDGNGSRRVVDALGNDVTNVRVGDEVFGTVDFKKSAPLQKARPMAHGSIGIKSWSQVRN